MNPSRGEASLALLWRARVALRRMLEDHTDLYLALQKIRYRGQPFRQQVVDRGTGIVIEGYPRSANSFAVRAFTAAQTRAVRIGHHTHSYAQVIKATRLGLPVILLIRHPDQCVVSLKALNIQSDQALEGRVRLRDYLLNYILFHEGVETVVERCVVADFDQVVRDFGPVIQRANRKFGADFGVFQHTPEAQKTIFDGAGFHLSPSPERERIKQRLLGEYHSAGNAALVRRARELHARVLAHAGAMTQ